MLPIALTCPVWWVARWTARMLASLAVVVACSLGAATLPLGPAAAAHAAPAAIAVDTATLRAGHLGGTESAGADPTLRALIRWSGGAADAVVRAGTGAPGPAARIGTGSAAAAGWTSSGADAAADRQAVPVGAPDSLVRGVVVAPVDRHRVLVGLVPATVGSRAPPAR
ncbi:hypothetical protein [Micromonospora sp. CB01531]|uniref:hypothetical protein n=1 Tax=Micromonospora sp. CB01531 TaxID=1718947 RepID=UPI00095FABDF|nr:hypothetical protein [Micromonospora sp. CB01531]OKI45231.1 hypothetical protein A6A27_12615 [Micromonospora sp. CB01531]